jgi:signal peptidase II
MPVRPLVPMKTRMFVAVAAVVVLLDQVTKSLVVHNVRQGRERIEVIQGFFAIVHAQNPGAAIGLLSSWPTPVRMGIFFVFTIVAAGVLISMVWQLPRNDRFQSGVLGLILAGALGNAIDRAIKQTVTDFALVYTDWPPLAGWLHRHHLPSEYPTFNVADSALVVGVGLFLVRYLFLDDAKEADDPDEPAAVPSAGPPAAASPSDPPAP